MRSTPRCPECHWIVSFTVSWDGEKAFWIAQCQNPSCKRLVIGPQEALFLQKKP